MGEMMSFALQLGFDPAYFFYACFSVSARSELGGTTKHGLYGETCFRLISKKIVAASHKVPTKRDPESKREAAKSRRRQSLLPRRVLHQSCLVTYTTRTPAESEGTTCQGIRKRITMLSKLIDH